jgi:hypothetical protein
MRKKRRRSEERFEWAVVAEQGRHLEALRKLAASVREELSNPLRPEESLRGKVAALNEALTEMRSLTRRIEVLRMVSEATDAYRRASDDGQRDRARTALMLALDALDRQVPER